MTNKEIQQAASEHANKHWAVLEKPNEHDNTRDDFIAGARWAAEKLERMRHESNLNPKTLRQLRIEDDLAQALILLRAIAKIRYRTPASPEEAEESNNTMVKIYNFLAKLE